LFRYWNYDTISLDYEGTGLDPWNVNFKILGFSLSAMTSNYAGISTYVSFDREITEDEKYMLSKFLEIKSPWCYNAKYEIKVTWANISNKFIKLNDSFVLCKLKGSIASLKANARKYLDIDYWEEVVYDIVDLYEKIFSFMKLIKSVNSELFELLITDYQEAVLYINSQKVASFKGASKFLDLIKVSEDILGKSTQDSLKAYPNQWASVPQEILGEYCCYDSFYTLVLRNMLYDDSVLFYYYYLSQTWLACVMESYGLKWNDETASELETYYSQECCENLYKLISYLNLEPDKQLLAKSIMDNSESYEEKFNSLRYKVFNPLSNTASAQAPFWESYKTNYSTALSVLYYLDVNINKSSKIPTSVLNLIDKNDTYKN
jgi:hypothetical protein